jgi:hypothetical protein
MQAGRTHVLRAGQLTQRTAVQGVHDRQGGHPREGGYRSDPMGAGG